jgi:F-box-like
VHPLAFYPIQTRRTNEVSFAALYIDIPRRADHDLLQTMPEDLKSKWKQWETVREEVDSQINALERQILELKTGRNALAPISILPEDIMGTIFLEVKTTAEGSDENRKAWILSSHVCRRWRDMMLDYPLLWSGFAPGDVSLLEQALARSKDVPLTIKFHSNSAIESALPVLSKALSQTSRLKDLNLRGYATTLERVFAPLITAAPILQVLSIESTDGLASLSPDFLNQDAPSLQELRLKDYTVSLTSPLLRGLTHLMMHVDETSASIPGNDVLNALGGMAGLVDLDLDLGNVDTDDMESSRPATELPHLKKLTLKRSGRLFPSLRVPAACKVWVSCAKVTEADLERMACTFVSCWLSPTSVACEDPPMQSARVEENSAKTTLSLFGWPEGFQTKTEEAHFTLLMERDSRWTTEMHHTLINLARLSRVQTFCLWWWMEPPEWLELVVKFSSAKGIYVQGSEDAYRLLRALRDGSTSEEGNKAASWLPNLTALRFQDANFASEFSTTVLLDELLDVLAIRSEGGVPLQRLIFNDCTGISSKTILKALRSHISEDVVLEK